MTSSLTNLYRFKDITVVPSSKELTDIVLSRTQRKTPTEVHKQFKISRIRGFYMRKVKYCQQTIHDKLTDMLTQFPKLDDIHPFYADLCNVLYDRDHYKIALGQVNAVRAIVDNVAKDYVRLMKYADSLYKCKMLKRAALGRMCTALKKLQQSFIYLEEVRQHLARLPSINPHTRTLVLAGYPNVGKSSFINAISHANVEVQPYAFTTKSLFVGHFDYCYSRWQVIDTPGILDRPLEDRNTVEMTAITALAHIQAAVLYVVDLSEQCGFSLDSQVKLFHSIKPLFKNKPLLVVLNKNDIRPFESLSADEKKLIQSMKDGESEFEVEFVRTSTLTLEGVDAAKNRACDLLLESRVAKKTEAKRVDSIMNRLFETKPNHEFKRPPFIPEAVIKKRQLNAAASQTTKDDEDDEDEVMQHDTEEPVAVLRKTEKELQEAGGGAGVYSMDLRKGYQLKVETWKYDVIPEIYGGKNIADFVDPDIDAKLAELEKEEAQLLEQDGRVNYHDPEWAETQKMMRELHSKIELTRLKNRLARSGRRPPMPRPKVHKKVSDATARLAKLGFETADMEKRLMTRAVSRDSKMKKLTDRPASTTRRVALRNRATMGLSGPKEVMKAEKLKRAGEKYRNRKGMAGEADRFIGTKMPKHLYSGKLGRGSRDWR
eukprot:GHVS01091555.1.p2 GENE.GHVS01091555.1~~GHVS01091555.1.p2  ORF type:complete len:682 (+),score=101.11 GHVS01091555.1:74-2047(+)